MRSTPKRREAGGDDVTHEILADALIWLAWFILTNGWILAFAESPWLAGCFLVICGGLGASLGFAACYDRQELPKCR